MELKRLEQINELKYPEESSFYTRKANRNLSKNTLFSTLLISMLSNNQSYGVEGYIKEPLIEGPAAGVQLTPRYYIHSALGDIAHISFIIAIIALITTIIFTVQFLKLKKENNLTRAKLIENEINAGVNEKTIRLKKRKKRLIISTIIFGVSIIIFIVWYVTIR